MTILTAPVSWRRHQPPNETRASHDLTPEEQANAKAAIRFLRARFGG